MSALLPPDGFDGACAYCSPKLRARQTAACLGLEPIFDERLVEQDWGAWEGLTRGGILARDGRDAFERAGSQRGIEFRPPGGESTGEVHARVQSFLTDVATKGEDAIVVAHLGVLRAAYALATGWDMSAAMPPELDPRAALILLLSQDGTPQVSKLNAPLRPRLRAGGDYFVDTAAYPARGK
jgi:broad specificity phosphatase PhoE